MNTSLTYILSILWFVLWICAIVDCVKSNNPNKLVWIVVIILLPFLGSILYFLIGRKDILV
ncbi:MAG TPA: PLD nuclease N-terminal domain-containing protein [Opitutaceae bacterium]|nr:PLD nuclease N-terminal domain-containing protein [Opitutaceae bacterium]